MYVIIRVYINIYSPFITQGWYEFGQYQSASCNNWADTPSLLERSMFDFYAWKINVSFSYVDFPKSSSKLLVYCIRNWNVKYIIQFALLVIFGGSLVTGVSRFAARVFISYCHPSYWNTKLWANAWTGRKYLITRGPNAFQFYHCFIKTSFKKKNWCCFTKYK